MCLIAAGMWVRCFKKRNKDFVIFRNTTLNASKNDLNGVYNCTGMYVLLLLWHRHCIPLGELLPMPFDIVVSRKITNQRNIYRRGGQTMTE
jgi:hypothetical protein